MSKETSTVEYLSNIQVIDTSVRNDTKYMTFVHDPFALDRMSKLINIGTIQYIMTNLQVREMNTASKHCKFAYKDDYPWGTIEIDGEKKVVCKCIKQDCKGFRDCRKGLSAFVKAELDDKLLYILQQNGNKKGIEESYRIGKIFKENLIGCFEDTKVGVFATSAEDVDKFRVKEVETSIDKSSFFITNNNINSKQEEKSTEEEQAKVKQVQIVVDFDTALTSFYQWMLDTGHKISTATGYVSGIRSADEFVKNKGISDISVLACKTASEVEEFIKLLENSKYFKASISNFIISLKCYLQYINETNLVHYEENNTSGIDNSSDVHAEQSVDNNGDKEVIEQPENYLSGDGFGKFIETEQDNVIFAKSDKRMVVNAGPGTGKTYTLIEKLIYMVNDLQVDPEEILVLCFSRVAVEVVEKRLQTAFEEERIGLNWHSIDIRTFDSFATHLLAYVQENEKQLLINGFSLDKVDYDARISAAIDVLKKSNELIEQCTHLIVDEVQDLVSVRAKFVKQLIDSLPDKSGYTLLGDACQSIYDYQIQKGEINSTRFYSWIFSSQTNTEFWTFCINYRQVSKLEMLGNIYRKAILTGDDNARKNAMNVIYQEVEELVHIDFWNAEADKVLEIAAGKNLGILTRTNGQALKISTWFRNAGIPHKVQKRLTDNSLNTWISNIFRDYENDTIDRETFIELYSEKGDFNVDADDIWHAIEAVQYDSKNRYYVRDILYGILNNTKRKEFYTTMGKELITISNIHRSKGREFEKVIVLDDILLMENQDTKDILEHKVSYVAVTRAKEHIYKTNIGKLIIRTDKLGDRRAFSTGLNWKKKKPYLSHIEIGKEYDIDPVSFADDINTQRFFDIPESILGESVVMIKNKEYSEKSGYVCYNIFFEDNIRAGKIGRTSKRFYHDLTRILKDIYGLYKAEPYDYLYPEKFSEVYIDNVITILGSVNPIAVAGKKYNDMMVWKGITLAGFAKVDINTY